MTLMLGTVATGILLFFSLVWLPLHNRVTELRQETRAAQELLAWMQRLDHEIKTAALSPHSSNNNIHDVSALLALIQAQTATQPWAKNITRLQQNNRVVVLAMNHVSFDALSTWLVALHQQYGIHLEQISATATDAPGMVDVEVGLSASRG